METDNESTDELADIYGRASVEWDQLTTAALDFLIEQARLRRTTSYTELNATLIRRTQLPGFDFDLEHDRAAVGELLNRVTYRNYPETGFMITALVQYLNANDAGPGFYQLARNLGQFSGKTSADREAFWVGQVRKAFDRYAHGLC